MKIDSLWLKMLAKKQGIKAKDLRDALWPTHPSRSLSYFDQYSNIGIETVEKIADVLNCSLDELMRRDNYATPTVQGNNNQVGNVHINSDVRILQSTITAQKKLITQLEKEINRLHENMASQLKAKDEQIERLIKLAQGDGYQ